MVAIAMFPIEVVDLIGGAGPKRIGCGVGPWRIPDGAKHSRPPATAAASAHR